MADKCPKCGKTFRVYAEFKDHVCEVEKTAMVDKAPDPKTEEADGSEGNEVVK